MTNPRRALNVQTPGVSRAPTPEEMAENEAATDAMVDVALPAGEAQGTPRSEALVTLTQAQLDVMMRRAAEHALGARATAAKPAEAALPDQSEIDPRAIVEATLSKQGYVMPIMVTTPQGMVVPMARAQVVSPR
jgi:hypothetical protein